MSFQTGLSGLNASSQGLQVIGNNIANANTYGMKSSTADFSELVASAIGTASGNTTGMGVTVGGVSQSFTQGTIDSTGNSLDLAINGGGFFQVTMPDGSTAYTRAGNFTLNSTGGIVTSNGATVMGYPTNAAGQATSLTPQALTLPTTAPIAASATTTVTAQFNLNGSAAIASSTTPATPVTTYGSTLTCYDGQGNSIPVSLYFTKTAANTWEVYSSIKGAAPVDTTTALTFNNTGALTTTPATLTLNLPNPDGTTTFPVTVNLAGTTQYGSAFNANNVTQNGYTSGSFTGLSISTTGTITAQYSNGQTQAAGQIALANFRNTQGLGQINGGYWVQTASSGQPVLGAAGAGSFGNIQEGALEQSNVNLTNELVNMMTAQRTYQANAQTIKTEDQLMQTLVSMR
ncbi:MAG: flagellar hook protein FlgE [Curvibacter sp.]|nr:flagellar hook protein FlgE [Curvibacter sp.]